MAFDVSGSQGDQIQMQDQSTLMMPPQIGKLLKYTFENISMTSNITGQDENDSQQAAEAMIQLGYYSTSQQQHEESSEFDPNYDPNYDPSDFLIKKDSDVQPETIDPQQYQEPYEYASHVPEAANQEDMHQMQNYYGAFAQDSFNVNDFGFQQPQQMQQDEFSIQSQPSTQPQGNDGGGLADLEISDSDDEDGEVEANEEMDISQNQADASKEDVGLWF